MELHQVAPIQTNQTPTKPPNIRGLPLLGAIPQVIRQQIRFFEDAHRQYGDVFTVNLGVSNMVILNRPEHAQHVFRDQVQNYTKNGVLWDMIRSFIGNGLPVSEGAFWIRQRRMMQPQFHRQRLEALTQYMIAAIDEGLDEWERFADSGEPFNIASEFANITMKVIVRTMFGTGLSREEVPAITESLTFALDYMTTGLVTSAMPAWMPVPGRARYQRAIKRVDDTVFRIIERRRREELSDDLISLLLHMVDDETGEQMTDAQLRDEAVSIFLAGYETTSVAMTWSAYFLTENPDLMTRLRSSVDETLGSRQPEFADLPALTYPRWVMQEALRLYSPVFFVGRKATERDVIDNYVIEPGQDVAILIHNIHRHPDHWTHPEIFDPERFAPEASEARHQLAWMPFGAGQRQCIGRDFALMEGQLILSKLMQRYELTAVPERQVKPRIGLTLRTQNGVYVTIKRRETA